MFRFGLYISTLILFNTYILIPALSPSSHITIYNCSIRLLLILHISSSISPIKNLRLGLGVSLENYFSLVGYAWHLLPWFLHGQLTDFSLENYSALCAVVCGHRWFTVFHYWNMDHYRRAATGEFPESIEVYPDETPWTVPEIRQ